jgi:hypothetical protein
MTRKSDRNLQETLSLTDRMVELAARGDGESEDIGCGILYGVLLDSAYKIRKLAVAESAAHRTKASTG